MRISRGPHQHGWYLCLLDWVRWVSFIWRHDWADLVKFYGTFLLLNQHHLIVFSVFVSVAVQSTLSLSFSRAAVGFNYLGNGHVCFRRSEKFDGIDLVNFTQLKERDSFNSGFLNLTSVVGCCRWSHSTLNHCLLLLLIMVQLYVRM